MKYVIKGIVCASFLATGLWSMSAMAVQVGVVDMQKIFQSSPDVKKIDENLKSQFTARKQKLDQMGKALQENMKKYQVNKSVMNNKSLADLEGKINQQRQELQKQDAQFQKDLYAAQNEQTGKFLNKVKGVVEIIAKQDKLEIVESKRSLLYSADELDITSKVMDALSKAPEAAPTKGNDTKTDQSSAPAAAPADKKPDQKGNNHR